MSLGMYHSPGTIRTTSNEFGISPGNSFLVKVKLLMLRRIVHGKMSSYVNFQLYMKLYAIKHAKCKHLHTRR